MTDLLGVLAAYLLGSVPFGLLLSRLLAGVDPRTQGSRNIGATNVVRTGGWGLGLTTLALDIAKGAGGVALGRWVASDPSPAIVEALIVAAPAAGHIYPVWLGFRGGKGVATAVGVLALADPVILAVAAVVFLLLVVPVRIVSLGSMGAATAALVAVWLLRGASPGAVGITVVAVLILWRHRGNAVRLVRGEEARMGRARGGGSAEATSDEGASSRDRRETRESKP
jgi:glycerol-3-phosphate acyltransferase PlsY